MKSSRGKKKNKNCMHATNSTGEEQLHPTAAAFFHLDFFAFICGFFGVADSMGMKSMPDCQIASTPVPSRPGRDEGCPSRFGASRAWSLGWLERQCVPASCKSFRWCQMPSFQQTMMHAVRGISKSIIMSFGPWCILWRSIRHPQISASEQE